MAFARTVCTTSGKGIAMSNPLRVDTDELLARAATFNAEAEDSRLVSTSDGSHVESRIQAFGEINAVMHDMFRSVHQAKQRSWDDHAGAEDEHGKKLRDNVHGYDTTDSTNANDLGQIDDFAGGMHSGPSFSGGGGMGIGAQVRPSFPGLHEQPHPYAPGVGPIDGIQGGMTEGPTFVDGRSDAGQTRPSMPGLEETPQPVQRTPAQVRPAD